MGCTITVKSPKMTSYQVTGNTLKEVWDNVLKKGPKDPNDGKKVAALTATEIVVADRWDPELRRGSCLDNGKMEAVVGVKNMSITVYGEIKMPKLGSNKLSKSAKKEWDRFIKKLAAHEREHMDVTEKVAVEMSKVVMKMEGIGLGADDKKAFEAGKKAFLDAYVKAYGPKQLSKLIAEAHKKFDKATKHGANHGAVLNYDIK